MSFFEDLFDPAFPLLRNALLLGLIAALPLGIVGSTVVARRISYLIGAIAHASLAGIGLVLYLRATQGWLWLSPVAGALVAAVLSAWLVGWISQRHKEREDTLISLVWAAGMALGLIFIQQTPGYIDAMSYLFGDILLLSTSDLWLTASVAIIVTATGWRYHHAIEALCFDREFARLRGIDVIRLDWLILTLIALTVTVLVTLVGIILVIALVTLPAAIASRFVATFSQMLVAASGISALLTTLGITLSYLVDLPTGPVIILLGAAVYALTVAIKPKH